MKAVRIRNQKYVLFDGSIAQIVVWLLPHPTKDRPHGYKYRLNYCTAGGVMLVRYDNELGKGEEYEEANDSNRHFHI